MPESVVRPQLPLEQEDWIATCEAPRFIGLGAPVERWALARHFLLQWLEWRELADRWHRYFGQPASSEPKTWLRARRECGPVAGGFLANQDLIEAIRMRELAGRVTAIMSGFGPMSAEALYHEIARLEALKLLVDELSLGAVPQATAEDPWDWVNRWERRLQEQHRSLTRAEQETLRQFIRCYRRSLLAYSWLVPEQVHRTLIGWETPMQQPGQPDLNHVPPDQDGPDLGGEVQRILGVLKQRISEMGYEAFLEDLLSEDLAEGAELPSSGEKVNIIPGFKQDCCCPLLIALSRGAGKRSAIGFPRIMELMKSHLFQCKGITREVVFLCDQWDSATLRQDHLPFLRACHRAGIHFTFLMVGPTGRTLSHVAVDLSE
jgi:hypothetical protein